MENNYVRDPLEQEFPEVEVEKNAKATFMESFEDYLEEEYLDEASIWDKVKGKAAELKDKAADFKDRVADAAEQKFGELEKTGKDLGKKVHKAVTGKTKLTSAQEFWRDQTAEVIAKAQLQSLENYAIIDELNTAFNEYWEGAVTVHSRNPQAEQPSFSMRPAKDFKTACDEATSFVQGTNYEEFNEVFGKDAELPVLVCINKNSIVKNPSAELQQKFGDAIMRLQKCPSAQAFSFEKLLNKSINELATLRVVAIAIRRGNVPQLFIPQAVLDTFGKDAK